jgi:hypothetical protein
MLGLSGFMGAGGGVTDARLAAPPIELGGGAGALPPAAAPGAFGVAVGWPAIPLSPPLGLAAFPVRAVAAARLSAAAVPTGFTTLARRPK